MATFDQLVTISKDAGFYGRIYVAMLTAATAVATESSTTTGHTARYSYAVRTLNSNSIPQGIIFAVLSNPTISAEANPATTPDFGISDADIQFQINSIWSALAGA